MNSDAPLQPENEDPEEDLKRENDFMKIKLQAEFGAEFSDMDSELPAEIEQTFLNSVYEFEKAWEKQEVTTVAKLLNYPKFTPFEKLDPGSLETALQAVLDIYSEANINIEFTYDYPEEVQYRFATDELPLHETVFVNMPGMMLSFSYEEFHPNHAGDMEEMARTFIEGWFSRDVEKCKDCLSKELILESGEFISAEKVVGRLSNMFDSFDEFGDTDFFIAETSYEKQETEDKEQDYSLGYVEGAIRWLAVLENGEKLPMAGPFKFYFESKFDYWTIMYFVMPGWKW